jgi:glutathione S-transferase
MVRTCAPEKSRPAVRLFKMLPSRPSFDAYLARITARPAFQRAEKIAAG